MRVQANFFHFLLLALKIYLTTSTDEWVQKIGLQAAAAFPSISTDGNYTNIVVLEHANHKTPYDIVLKMLSDIVFDTVMTLKYITLKYVLTFTQIYFIDHCTVECFARFCFAVKTSADKMILQIFDIFSHDFSPFSTQLTLIRPENSIGLKKD